MIFAEIIEESYDTNMQDYFDSEEYLSKDKEVTDLYNRLKSEIDPALAPLLRELYDAFTSHEGSVAANSYVTGVNIGFKGRDQFLTIE